MSQECPKTDTKRMDKTTQTRHPQRTGLHLLDALEQQSTISCRFTHQRSAVRYRPRPLNAASVSGLRKVEPDFAVGLRSRAIGRLRCVLARTAAAGAPSAARGPSIQQTVGIRGVVDVTRVTPSLLRLFVGHVVDRLPGVPELSGAAGASSAAGAGPVLSGWATSLP